MRTVTPNILKRVLELCGFTLVASDEFCWIMESNGLPAVIPFTMKLIPSDVLESILSAAEIDEPTFVELLKGLDIQPPRALPAQF